MLCPDLRYLMHTQQVIDLSFEQAENFKETYPDEFADLPDNLIYSLSKESEHEGDLILLKTPSSVNAEIYRLAATHDDGQHGFEFVKLFSIKVLQSIERVEIYDDFAFIVFEDASVMLAFRPTELGGQALYNTRPSSNPEHSGYLSYENQQITYYDIVPDSSQQYNYILNLLTQDNNADVTGEFV